MDGTQGGNKRVTSINFYQNSHTQANKIKNALDMSMKSSGVHQPKNATSSSLNNSAIILNESMKASTGNANIFNKSNGSSYMTAQGNT